MKNVTPPVAGPRPVTTPNASSRRNQIVILAVFVIVLVLLVRACAGGENRYEKIAHEFTSVVQNNDLTAAQKLMNAETGANFTRQRLGAGADLLAPLGKLKHVKEVTPANDGERVHEFDLTMDQGAVHARLKLDPEDKIVLFHYDKPLRKK